MLVGSLSWRFSRFTEIFSGEWLQWSLTTEFSSADVSLKVLLPLRIIVDNYYIFSFLIFVCVILYSIIIIIFFGYYFILMCIFVIFCKLVCFHALLDFAPIFLMDIVHTITIFTLDQTSQIKYSVHISKNKILLCTWLFYIFYINVMYSV